MESSYRPDFPTTETRTEHRPPIKTYGKQWSWDPEIKDYIQTENGVTRAYTDYQRSCGDADASIYTEQSSSAASFRQTKEAEQDQDAYSAAEDSNVEDGEGYVKVAAPPFRVTGELEPRVPDKSYNVALDPRFTTVAKPKRFFSVGRIFKTVWFEPGGRDQPGRATDLEWRNDCPFFHDEKPCARFRFFVVVRKRLHHSLCFSIGTYMPPNGATATATATVGSGSDTPPTKNAVARTTNGGRGGRAQDSVVLYSSSVEPPAPYDTEGITREPVAVIIEDEDQYVSPLARIDCARIYTVEDSLRVMKIGRVHMSSLASLEEYFRESVA
ncbi:hypothetical protein B0T19DRAFT_77720 [Cercophora scortea]|uniref:DUF6590 domain-containing protein n=1 Tax=Cercophora scortea TaxID=314031 RepID=A0AAE0MMW0_9PEZI|nr:hypothetical protein B0T19DRAFT_77720 [Cercophora scortea]